MRVILFMICSLIFLESCTLHTEEDERVSAYVPVYLPYSDIAKIELQPQKKLGKAGKIYTIRNMLLVSEVGEGVHIFDNSDPSKPSRITFISIPANQDIEMRNQILYADNGLDLLSIDLSDIRNPKVLGREKNVFPYPDYPPFENVKFVCADPSKGYVINWELKEVTDPKCSR